MSDTDVSQEEESVAGWFDRVEAEIDGVEHTEADFHGSAERSLAADEAFLDEHPEVRARVEAELHEMGRRIETLASLRKARGFTQSQLADQLEMPQSSISRLEHSANMYLETLNRFVGALGGELEVLAIFEDSKVELNIEDLLGVLPETADEAKPIEGVIA